MKGKIILALVLVVYLAFSAAGCVIERVSEREPEFSVVFCEEQLREYIRRARADEDNWDTLYREIVLEPIQQELRDRDSIINLDNYHQPIPNLNALEDAIDLFMAMDITGVVEDALTRCNDFIQGVDTVVYILIDDPDDILARDMLKGAHGVSGLSCSTIVLAINPTAEGLLEMLPYTVAHEYHHVNLGRRNYWGGELLDVLLMEGRADSFANLVFPGRDVPWTSSLSPEYEKIIWQDRVKGHLDSTDLEYVHSVTKDEYWSGYVIGYHIVQAFIGNNPEVSVDQWTKMGAAELYEKSGYENWLGD